MSWGKEYINVEHIKLIIINDYIKKHIVKSQN